MARSEITTFYQRVRGPPPAFDVHLEEGESVCVLKMAGVTTRAGMFSDQIFTGRGRNKKLAIAAAAEVGLEFLKEQPMFQRTQPASSLWDVVAKLMAPQNLRKESEFEGHLLQAQKFNEGWIPIQLLQTSRPVVKWAKKYLPEALMTPETFLELIHKHLLAETFTLTAQAHIKKSADCRCIRRNDEYPGRHDIKACEALDASVAHGEGRSFKCILIPAKKTEAITEVKLEGGGPQWQNLAALLGTGPEGMLYWDKFGRSKQVHLEDENLTSELDDPALMAILTEFLGPRPGKERTSEADPRKPCPDTPRSENGTNSVDGSESANPQVDKRLLTEVRQPVLYSAAGSQSFNQRASWMLGKPVHGTALISYCRLRPCEWRAPSMKWASFPLPVFWAWVGACLPSAKYANSTQMPLLARLPITYRNAKAWFGASPADLLKQRASSELCPEGPEYQCKPTSDDPDAKWECTASLRLAGDESPLCAESADCGTEDAARQQAALSLLHEYERRFCSVLLSGEKSDGQKPRLEDTAEVEIQVKRQGEGETPVDGSLVRFFYRISRGGEGDPPELVAEGPGRIEWNSGGVAPKAEALMRACRPGGTASCSLHLPLDSPNPFSSSGVWCTLEISLEQKVRFVGTAQTNSGQAMFVPPMSTQRHERMEKLLNEAGASTVLDIGCGEGRLVEHLLKRGREGTLRVKKVVGLDLDESAARRGGKRICTRNVGLFDSETAPELELYQADSACEAASTAEAWGEYVGVEAAIFQEVVEHLDPGPLKWLGPCLLGALQPQLLLLSTPNREYNAVLHHLQSQLLPNGLRNSDHRFEWTRAEFQEWCTHLGDEFDYAVSFQDLGRASEEAKALEDESSPLFGQDLGGSTQIAVFKRRKTAAAGGVGSVRGTCVFDSKDLLAASWGKYASSAEPAPIRHMNGSVAETGKESRLDSQETKRPRI